MTTVVVSWVLSDEEGRLAQALLAVRNAEAAEAYAALVERMAAMEPPGDPGPAPVAETLVEFVTRIGLKSLRGELVRLRSELRTQNLRLVAAAYDSPDTLAGNVASALDLMGLRFDGLRVVKK